MTDYKKYFIAGGIVILALLGLSGYLYWDLTNTKTEKSEMEEVLTYEKEQLLSEYEELAFQFDGYQNIELDNQNLQDSLAQNQQRIQNLLEELRITKVTNARRIEELKKELATVREVARVLTIKVDELQRDNDRLAEENKQVRQENNRLSTETRDLRREKNVLTEKVTRASMLELTSVSCTPLNKRDRKTRILSHITKLQFDYTLSKNVTCSRGAKIVYIRVNNPQGELLLNDSVTFRFENEDILYSCSHEVEYEGESLSDTQYLPVSGELQKGLYNADFFVDGQMITSFPFELK